MNTKTLASHYAQLSVEERFRLIVAACDRDDGAEQERLKNASKRITLSAMDYAPLVNALHDLAFVVFLALLEEATAFDDAFERWRDADIAGFFAARKGFPPMTEKDREALKDRLLGDRFFFEWLAQGFMLRTSAAGWKLFCNRLGISPFGLWKEMPGFERLQRALKLVEDTPDLPGAVLSTIGMARWLNFNRPAGLLEVRESDVITAEWVADGTDAWFRARVRSCGG